MAERIISSSFYGNLGVYRQIRKGLYRSGSERVHLLGEGGIGGKGEGTLFLDGQKHPGFSSPRSLIVCGDYFDVAHRQLTGLTPIAELNPQKVCELIDTIKGLNFSAAIAVRSSAEVEDKVGGTAAGKFATEFHARALDTMESRRRFVDKLLTVYNSAYTPEAAQYWGWHGYGEIPPLSVVIQEVVGSQWSYAPQYFLPMFSGIVNTASRRNIRGSTVLGLGLAAVGDAGLGVFHKLPVDQDKRTISCYLGGFTGVLNDKNIFCLDLASGDAVNLKGEAAADILPAGYVESLQSLFPGLQIGLARIGLEYERRFRLPFDFEWAFQAGSETISLVQIRPIKEKEIIKRPSINPVDVIGESEDVLGSGQKAFNHVICITSKSFYEFNGELTAAINEEDIRLLSAKYPKSMIFLATDVIKRQEEEVEGTGQAIARRLLPYADVVIVSDNARHRTGTGVQHLALNCADEGKILIYLKPEEEVLNQYFIIRILESGSKVESVGTERADAEPVEVYCLDRPIHVAADDEDKWGMVYLGEKTAG